MAEFPLRVHDEAILAARPEKNQLDPLRPYEYFVERECGSDRRIRDVATIFLTNRECPFHCLMCDLWKNTLDATVPDGAILQQVDYALARLEPAEHVKLYNSGNFFDRQAIPAGEIPNIAARLAEFGRVVVETHPRLCGAACMRFRDLLAGELEIALGLETVHPEVLPRLNKQMTLDDFDRAVVRLRSAGIHVRAFILLRPPYLSEAEGIHWAIRSMEHAFEVGVQCCTVIPTRAGNGVMEQLESAAQFSPPTIGSLETVHEAGIRLERGRVFVDLWDCERIFSCSRCGPKRKARMHRMNLEQRVAPPVRCDCCDS
jgi:radical SAM enzyme (TIGR01210 family)